MLIHESAPPLANLCSDEEAPAWTPRRLSRERVDWPTVEAVCAEMSKGKPLVAVLPQFPPLTPVMWSSWCRAETSAASAYAHAREQRAENLFEELIRLACEPPREVEGKVDSGWVQWRKNQIDTLKFAIAKMCPAKYGDKIEIEHTGTIQTVRPSDVRLALENCPLLASLGDAPAVVDVPREPTG